MLYCNRCGQCSFLSSDRFIEWENVSGATQRFIDPDTQEVVDYGEDDLNGTGDSTTYCPHCDSSDVEYDWDGDRAESQTQREAYEDYQERGRAEAETLEKSLRIKDSDWDLESNLSQ